VYSINSGFIFDPFNLEIGITPKAARENLDKKEYASGELNLVLCTFSYELNLKYLFYSISALMMALRLNEPNLITEILESIPMKDSECTQSKFLNLKKKKNAR